MEIADQVLVCYNAEFDKPKEIVAVAQKECAKTRRTPRFIKQDVLACPVLLPARAYFVCEGAPDLAQIMRPRWLLWKTPRKVAPAPEPQVNQPVPMATPELPPELPAHLTR